MKRTLTSDLGVFLLSGLLSVVVFVVALVVLNATLPGGLDRRQLFWFVGGFSLFLLVYLVAMWIYREIDSREGDVRDDRDG